MTANAHISKYIFATRGACLAAALGASFAVSGCGASIPNIMTGSISNTDKVAAPAAPVLQNDLTARALQVGGTAARAKKCGYNFDANKLRDQFVAAEAAANPADAAKAPQLYDAAFKGVSRGIATKDESYCTENRTADIKAALTRALAGDYTASAFKPEEAEESGGLFSMIGN